jgi:hypothetical protein
MVNKKMYIIAVAIIIVCSVAAWRMLGSGVSDNRERADGAGADIDRITDEQSAAISRIDKG